MAGPRGRGARARLRPDPRGLGSDDAGRGAFLARWPDLDTYLLQGMTGGTFAADRRAFAEPAVDRPVAAPGSKLVELPAGLTVRQQEPPHEHELNNTASMVLALCDGERTVAAMADELAACFALATPPLAEVSACVDGLRRAGILVARTLAERREALVRSRPWTNVSRISRRRHRPARFLRRMVAAGFALPAVAAVESLLAPRRWPSRSATTTRTVMAPARGKGTARALHDDARAATTPRRPRRPRPRRPPRPQRPSRP